MSSCSETSLTCVHVFRSHDVAGMHIGCACLMLAAMVVQVWELARTPPLVLRQQPPRQEAHGAPMQSESAGSDLRHAAACSHTEQPFRDVSFLLMLYRGYYVVLGFRLSLVTSH